MAVNQKTKLHLVDIDDMGSIVREILNDPEKFVGEDELYSHVLSSFFEMKKFYL